MSCYWRFERFPDVLIFLIENFLVIFLVRTYHSICITLDGHLPTYFVTEKSEFATNPNINIHLNLNAQRTYTKHIIYVILDTMLLLQELGLQLNDVIDPNRIKICNFGLFLR